MHFCMPSLDSIHLNILIFSLQSLRLVTFPVKNQWVEHVEAHACRKGVMANRFAVALPFVFAFFGLRDAIDQRITCRISRMRLVVVHGF